MVGMGQKVSIYSFSTNQEAELRERVGVGGRAAGLDEAVFLLWEVSSWLELPLRAQQKWIPAMRNYPQVHLDTLVAWQRG